MEKAAINHIRKWTLRIGGMVLLFAVLAGIALAIGFSWLVSESGLYSNDDLARMAPNVLGKMFGGR